MKHVVHTICAIACMLVCGIASLSAQSVNRVISYQGLITQADGTPLPDGQYRMVIRLFDSPTIGTLVFTETQDVTVTKGLFTILIGQVEGAEMAAVDFNRPLWLETAIEGSTPFQPRTRMAVVPNAIVAERALVADALNPEFNDLVRSLNGGKGSMVIKGTNGISVSRIQDTIRITGPVQNGDGTGVETISSNDGSISISNPAGPDAIIRVADGGITSSKLASGSVTGIKIADGAVTGSKIADGVITSAKIAAGVIPTSLPPNGNANGDLTGTYPSPLVRAGSITTDKLANSAVVEGKIADGAVTSAKIPAGGITTSRIADGAVTSLKLQPTGVTPGTYGDYNKVVQMTVDTGGRIISARNVTLTGIQPGGPASGDLTGIYPFPQIDRNVAGTNIIAAINDNMNPLLWVDGMKVEPLADIQLSDVSMSGRLDSANLQIKQGAVGPIELADIAGLPTGPQGSGTLIPVITVDGDGRVQNLSTTVITGAPPVGAAGGDLAGTYPNPTINPTSGNNIINAVNNGGTAARINTARVNDPVTSGASDITSSGSLAAQNLQINVGVVGTTELANLHASTIGPIGSSTATPVVTIDVDGRITNLTSATITGVTPGGTAGGDLAGTYPNPTISTSATTGSRIVDAVRVDYFAGDVDINTPNNVVVLDPSGNLPTVYEQAFHDGNVTTPYISFLQPPATTTSTRVWTLPDATGTVVVAPSVGTTNRLTRFNAHSSIVDGSIDDNGSGTLSRAGNVAINVGTGHSLSTNGTLIASEGLSVAAGGASVTGPVSLTGAVTINGELSVHGAQNMHALIGSAPLFPGTQDHVVIVTAHSAIDVYLPPAPAAGRVYTIRNAATGVSIIAAGGADTIEAVPTVNLAAGSTVRLLYDGAGTWYNIGN
ncbi:MAG: hypothetical protein FGM24_00820 [Candidatus Kapabacteria bacterium]|nr:hypothetical protein [Candidatus Kapabacteria bacterium]